MSDDATPGLAGSEPAGETLDSIISGAIDKSEAPPEPAAAPVDSDTSERARDEKGRFAPKDSAAKASEPEQAPAANTADPKPDAQPAPAQSVEPPHTWSADDKAKFAKWPADVQIAVVDRYKAMEADYTRKTQQASELEKSASPYLNAIKPFEQYLTQLGPQIGKTPPDLIRDLLGIEYRLRNGSAQEKNAAFLDIGRVYGIDLAAMSRGEVALPDPAFQQMASKLAALEQRETQRENQLLQQQTEQATLQIGAFATAKDEQGRPRYPHFERVRGVIAQHLANGEAATLEDAYQKATEPIRVAIAEELAARQKQADEQRKVAVDKAQRASPVRSSGSQPGGSAKGSDLDSVLSDAIAKAGMA